MASMLVFAFYALCITGLVNVAQAQNKTQPPTDPNEGAPLSLSLKMLVAFVSQASNHSLSFSPYICVCVCVKYAKKKSS
jgi:hypothetical protein